MGTEPIKMGILCDKCGTELVQQTKDQGQVLCSYPPQIKVYCEQCEEYFYKVI